MKKVVVTLISVAIVLALAGSGMAKAVQLDLARTSYAPAEEQGTGKVILNNPRGAVNFIVQVTIKNAMPGTSYIVWINANEDLSPLDHGGVPTPWYYLGELTTNKVGNGNFHCNVNLDYSQTLTDVQVALNPGPLASYKSEKGEIEIK